MMWKLLLIYVLSPWSVKQNPEFTDHSILGMVLVQPAAGYFNNTVLGSSSVVLPSSSVGTSSKTCVFFMPDTTASKRRAMLV